MSSIFFMVTQLPGFILSHFPQIDKRPGTFFTLDKREMLLLGSGFLVYLFAFLISRQQV